MLKGFEVVVTTVRARSEQHCAGYVCDDLSQVSAHLYAAGTELPGGDVIVPGGLASVGSTTTAGASSLSSPAGASPVVDHPRTTLVEDVRDNVDPVVNPGGEESRDFDLGVS